jgi:hypothetical protein
MDHVSPKRARAKAIGEERRVRRCVGVAERLLGEREPQEEPVVVLVASEPRHDVARATRVEVEVRESAEHVRVTGLREQ